MPQVRVLILRAPGTNCDQETAYAFQQAGASTEIAHLNRLLESPQWSDSFQILCLPGGFSYGDDIAAGRIVAVQLRHHLTDTLTRFRDDGKLVLGICNGFQVLIKSGLLLPDCATHGPQATLTWNTHGRFEDRWVHLAVDGSKSVFLRGIERMYLPIAHAEGQFIARDAEQLSQLEQAGQLVLRYVSGEVPTGTTRFAREPLPFPANPNGSQANVAGVCDATGRVLGLMPHPERHVDRTHHPHWTRRPANVQPDGLPVFRNAVEFFR